MTKYPLYVESGVAWMGELPSHWFIRKLSRSYSQIGSGTTPTSGEEKYHLNGSVNWINTGDLNDGILDSCSKKVTERALADYSALKIFPRGALVMAMYGATIGKLSILDIDGCVNQACCVLNSSRLFDNKYLFYWLFVNRPHIISMASGGGQPNISQELVRSLRVPCPSLYEQKKIVLYLDTKTSLVDETIRKKRRLIEILQEECISFINIAMAKGIEPVVRMKDSGISWLGEIPSHWKVTRLKYILSTQRGALKPGPFGSDLKTSDMVRDGKYKVYTQRNVIVQDVSVGEDTITEEKFRDLRVFEVNAGDILVTTRGTIGKTMVVPLNNPPGIIHPCLIRLRPDTNIVLTEWLVTYFNKTSYFKDAVNLQSNSTIIDVIYGYTLSEVKIPLPPTIKEQHEILNCIYDHLKVSEIAVTRLSREIELLQEYRTSLIYELVNGKRCVLSHEELEKLTKDQELVS